MSWKRFAVLCAGLLALLPAVSHAGPPWGTGESKGEDLVVSMVTFGPGNDVESWWGHGALVVEDRRLHEGRLYNYGMFSFDEKMLARFALGRLEFWAGEADVGLTLQAYAAENRSIHIQALNLLPAERLQIAKSLADNVLPENRDYLYDHYHDNCVTRPRDIIDRATGGQLKAATAGRGRYTLRGLTQLYTAVNPPMSVLLDFMMNGSIDKPITQSEEAFLPDELEAQLARLSFKNANGETVPYTRGTQIFYASTRAPPRKVPPDYTLGLLGISFGLGAIALALGYATGKGSAPARVTLGVYQALVMFVPALLGTVLFVMWIITNHTVTYHNENLFLASPLTWVVYGRGLSLARGKRADAAERLFKAWRFLLGIVALGLVLKVLPWFRQNNVRVLELLLPLELAFFGAAHLARRVAFQVGVVSALPAREAAAKGTPDRSAGSL